LRDCRNDKQFHKFAPNRGFPAASTSILNLFNLSGTDGHVARVVGV